MKNLPPPPVLVAAVDRVLAPYKRLFSAETVENMRREALTQLAAHPYPTALTRALSGTPTVQESAVLGPEGEADTDSAKGVA